MHLEIYANTLADQFDEHRDRYREYGDRRDHGMAAAYRVALAQLHACTGGQFGAPLEDLEDPHQVKQSASAL
ncbi:hypothetical protein [Actinophytocola sp. NPDC049390]|uniref:hypothetical protein n=1 Tax=Actinophytocola sp. NPDC049390 TaxID=3363894 RepID=UPI0037997E24